MMPDDDYPHPLGLHVTENREHAARASTRCPTMTAREKILRLLAIHGSHGNWNFDAYMLGMYNGLECALATLEERPPQYRSKPDEGWVKDQGSVPLPASSEPEAGNAGESNSMNQAP